MDIEKFGNPFFKSDGLTLSGGVVLRIQRVTERVKVVVSWGWPSTHGVIAWWAERPGRELLRQS